MKHTSRRAFCKHLVDAGLTLGAGIQTTAQLLAAGQVPKTPNGLRVVSDPSAATGSRLLQSSDFSYVGYYDVPGNLAGTDPEWGQGLTHRYVGGELRFLTFTYDRGYRLIEFSCPAAVGGTVSDVTARWNDIWAGKYNTTGKWCGLWWEEQRRRLWTTSAIDYPDDVAALSTKSVHTRILNADGTVSDVRGQIGLTGIGARRVCGGATAIPDWFRSAYDVGPYAIGWGGYSSRLAQGLSASLGPTMYTIPDPAGFPDESDIPAGLVRTVMDHGSGTVTKDWYSSGKPTTFDRGVRNADVTNEYDSGNWLSPAPDGSGRWTWGDSANNTGCWIDSSQRRGFVIVPSFSSGRAWYENSTLHSDRRTFEIQVFDPLAFGDVLAGRRQPWAVQPSSRSVITLPGLGAGRSGNGPVGNVGGATYDAVSKRLFLYGFWTQPDIDNRIYVYQVDA